jgi:murein L,D-transpeptidase YcbB/YkuD
MRYVSDLRIGRVNPKKLKIHLDVEPKRYDLMRFSLELASSPQPKRLLDRIEPSFQGYHALLDALQHYRKLANDPELSRPLTVLPRSLRPGETYPDLERLIYRLASLGDLATAESVPIKGNVYTDVLAEAVRRFQGRHGLTQDGIIGRNTFAQLNVPISERVEQIRMGLERWRWLPDELGHRPVIINVPEYKLYALEVDADGKYQQVLDMEVIVGESYPKHQTPLFRGSMSYIVFSPYWNVPYNILKRELYAKIKADPAYLAAHNYEIVSAFHRAAKVFPPEPENIARLLTGELKLRQSPGPNNALGTAKFMFPNNHAVYLHGTPAKRLFRKDKRDFSHGCIRIADPPRMAAHVLSQESGWDRQRIDKLIAKGQWRQVGLSKPLEVYVLYGTAVADMDGTVRFFRDVYGHDDRLAQALHRDNPRHGS